MKRFVFAAAVTGLMSFGTAARPIQAIIPTMYNPNETVVDVSWPNCSAEKFAQNAAGIVGVTGGLDFKPNSCLRAEAAWFPANSLSLYMNTGYPGVSIAQKYSGWPKQCDADNQSCLAYNYGYNAALYALDYADSQQVHSALWWLDVETDNSWSADVRQNQASLIGMVDAIKHFNLLTVVGFYAAPSQWNQITGSWKNKYPAWTATGGAAQTNAVTYCNQQAFTDGPTRLSQYTLTLDRDYVC